MELSFAQAECARAVRAGDADRYFAALFAREPARARLMALYAFNLELARVVETVREPMIAEIRLAWWREALPAIVGGAPPAHAVATALGDALAGSGVGAEAFEPLVAARTAQAYGGPVEDLAALEAHVDATAGLVARLALRLASGGPGEEALRAASLGARAWGLVGTLRMLPFDAARGRVLLPRALLAREGINEEDILAGRMSPGLARVAAAISDRAAESLRDARGLARALPREGLPALLYVPLAADYARRLARLDLFREPAEIALFRRQLRLLAHAARGGI
ncbi:MAG: squalene/phytoene synthase family protein [Alphaproteobacteria bacterium]|nr:squalene/phytoene synthase family protein [Alphaproteobacteria bacterium]